MALPTSMLALRRELWAVSIDPGTQAVVGSQLLLTGAIVLDGRNVLSRAEVKQLAFVTVHTRSDGGWSGFSRVEAKALRAAVD
jgi:hypothetical protein